MTFTPLPFKAAKAINAAPAVKEMLAGYETIANGRRAALSGLLDSRYTARLAKRGASMKEYTIRPAFLPSVAAIKSFARSDTDAIIERPSEFLALKVGRRCKSPASFHPATGYAVEHGLVAGRAFGKAVARSS